MLGTEIAFPDISNSRFKFLLLGAGRSGTSLLAALLDAHVDIEVGFELFGDSCLRGKNLPESRDSMYYDRASAFTSNCIAEANKSSKPIWGNKITTEKVGGLNKHNLYNPCQVAVLETFFNGYLAGLKIVHILRDGRACVQSKLRRTRQPMERACTAWSYAVTIFEFLQSRPATYFIRYEDLVSDPKQTLSGVFDFLGVRFDPAVLQGTMSPKLLETYRNPDINQSRAHSFDPDHPSVKLIAEELRRCGYTYP